MYLKILRPFATSVPDKYNRIDLVNKTKTNETGPILNIHRGGNLDQLSIYELMNYQLTNLFDTILKYRKPILLTVIIDSVIVILFKKRKFYTNLL